MWRNNRAVTPTPGEAIVAVDLGDNFTIKGHRLSMIKDRQFDERADPHKHITEFVEICIMFRYDNTNADEIKLKLFPSSLAGDAKVWFNELSLGVIATWEQMRQAFSVTTSLWVVPKMKKPTMPTKVFEDEDIEETTMSGLTYDSPVNPNAKTTVIHGDSDAEVDEGKIEVEPSSSKQTKSDPPPLEVYKPKISYPQRLRKENMEERYAKFIDLIKEVRINVPLVDVLTGMPNYGKFLKDLVSNKRSVEYLSLVDLGASINLMPYLLYTSLSGNTLKPTRMRQPFLHTADAIIRVKNKELNIGVGDDRITFLIDKAMRHSHSNDDTCFRVDVIDEVTEEELDALLDDSKTFSTTSEKISESFLNHEFEEFMTIKIEEIPEQ
nr:hypothetical protein [Tanacetum cinerariifolium]